MPLIGIIGKPNVGKTTLFSALTLSYAKIAPYPFTTIETNKGIAYIRVNCICREFNIKDNPKNSLCINGIRYIPVEIVDVAGLVKEAWKGKGLGNKFLDEIRKADALIHVVDISGSTNSEGKIVKTGAYDPINDVEIIYNEIFMWIYNKFLDELKKDKKKIKINNSSENISFLEKKLSGFSIRKKDIAKVLLETNLDKKKINEWNENDIKKFIKFLLKKSKPMVIAANKADLLDNLGNINRLKEKYKDYYIIPVSAESELALRKASEIGIIKYFPGEKSFEIIKKEINEKQKKALLYIKEKVLKRYGSTGVQEVLETCYFKLLNYIAVFPVEDQNKLTDHHGNVLPDVFLVPNDTTAKDLAYLIHTDLGKNFIYAINVKTKQKVGENYVLKHRDVIKIVSAK